MLTELLGDAASQLKKAQGKTVRMLDLGEVTIREEQTRTNRGIRRKVLRVYSEGKESEKPYELSGSTTTPNDPRSFREYLDETLRFGNYYMLTEMEPHLETLENQREIKGQLYRIRTYSI